LYVVVIGGLLAFSSLRMRRDSITGIMVSVRFCFFAYKNLGAIHDVTVQRLATLDVIHQYSAAGASGPEHVLLEPTLIAPAYEGVRNFHIASDVLTIAALWAMELRRMRYARAETTK
jgi:hypothetical protein